MWPLARFQVKHSFRYQELAFRYEDGLEVMWGPEMVHRKEGSRMLLQDLHGPCGIGEESEERQQQVVCYRARDKTGIFDLEGRKKS